MYEINQGHFLSCKKLKFPMCIYIFKIGEFPCIPHLPEITIFITRYVVLNKVYTYEGGIK